MRTPLIVGNWKMNKTASEARTFVREFRQLFEASADAEVALRARRVAVVAGDARFDRSDVGGHLHVPGGIARAEHCVLELVLVVHHVLERFFLELPYLNVDMFQVFLDAFAQAFPNSLNIYALYT